MGSLLGFFMLLTLHTLLSSPLLSLDLLLSKTLLKSQNPNPLSLCISFSFLQMAKPKPSSLGFIGLLLLLSILSLSASDPDVPPPSSIHDLLLSKGLPAGLLPKAVRSYTIDESGRLEVFLDRPCLAKFETRVFFESVVRANLSYAALTDLVGLSQEELFLWLPVKDIIVDDPGSGLILFDIVVAHKQLSLSLFDNPPDCKPEEDGALIQPSGLLWNSGRKEKGFTSER